MNQRAGVEEQQASTVVQKYGGSSVADAEKIRNVAKRVAASAEGGNRVVVVVSAMGDTTDDLTSLALQISPVPPARELDMLLTAGERISAALLSMALIEMGHPAVSLTGSQAGIVTDTKHGKARIVDIRASRIEEGLSQGNIVIVAGFQGVSTTFDVTTLGRGGSDTTVVALAHSLGAELCEIYTDVDGVYTADPRIVPNARKLHAVSYEEMLEMAATGAKVLALRAVEYARNYGVVIHCRSSFTDETGTFVKGEDERMEKAVISAVTHDTSEAVVRIKGVPDRPGVAAAVFGAIAEEGINIDMIVQNVSMQGHTDVTFTMPKDDLSRSAAVMDKIVADVGAEGYSADAEIGKVSVIGAGMKTNPGVAAAMFQSLAEAGINIEVISTSAIRISCIVRGDDVERAVKVIHDRFELPEAALEREQHPGSPG
ncbi:MAG TPA: aspartate kinase [Actinomycetota bacterium]|nr:aspartate kinase [Actinomycetota bacterium]